MGLSLIAAIAKNAVIGHQGKLPWHISADLRHFKALTRGKPVIMGRTTYQSIGKPLPDRVNIILSRQPDFTAPGCLLADSPQQALALAADAPEVMIIGGSQIYQLFLPECDKMYLTLIDHAFTGDDFFPAWNPDEWQEIDREDHPPQPDNPYPFSFITLSRRTAA